MSSGGGGVKHAVAAPMSGAVILSRLIPVDGTGSGLDADLLDGQHGSYYRDAGNINAGTLASARGGTGVSNAGTLTNASNTTITGGGTIALGGFTLTIPATGTAALLGTTQTITGVKTFDADLVMATNRNIRTVTNADYLSLIGGVTLSSDPGFQIFGSTYGSGISGRIYMDCARLVLRGINGATNGVVDINGTTSSTSTTTGALVVAGGFGCAGAGYFGGLINGAAGITIAGAILNNQSSGQFLKIRRSDFGTMEFGVSDNETWRIQAQGTSAETLAWQKVSSGSPTTVFTVTNALFALASGISLSVPTQTPASAAASGVTGTIAWDTSYLYVCTATNTWKRVAIATW
jgi:hypothetical protein